MRSKRLMILMVLLAGIVLSTGTASAVTYQVGDMFGGGSSGGLGNVYHYRGGALIATYLTGVANEETGMAFDTSGNLYVTNFGSSTITKFDNSGNVIAPNPFVSNDVNSHNESILFNVAGDFYVGQADGTRDIIKRASDGTFIARYDVATGPRGTDWIDLAADQNTMYYTSEGRTIRRYDVSTGTQLTDFATLPGSGTAFALRLLGDGGLLVADRDDVKRLDNTGAVVQTYDVAGVSMWFALNLDPDGTSFWSGDIGGSGIISKFDIATGVELVHIVAPSSISGLAVFGEITQGGGGGGEQVPEPGTMILLGSGLLAIAGFRKRMR